MSTPILLMASGETIGRYGDVFTDFGALYTMRVRTVEISPVGVGGAALFFSTYVLITFNVAFECRVTPVLDGVELWDEAVDIIVTQAPADGHPQTHLFEIGWSLPRMRGAVEVGRYAMMGRWFQVEIAMPCPVGDQGIIEVENFVEHEFEIVSQGQAPQ